ncbi:response regulator [Phenylobacterium terrae]|uniref:response regulator n=1 Tax=Phenylobacterium terrae TaxID=2665495 RepID=UPI00366F9AD2
MSLKDLNLSVLAVDDEPSNLRVFEQIFEVFGARVTTAAGGAEAMALLEVRAFDLLLVDLHMPGMTGLELMRLLRTSSFPSCEAPAIAVTADVYSYRRGDYLRLGFDDFLPKPVPVASLVETVRRLATAPRRSSAVPASGWGALDLRAG